MAKANTRKRPTTLAEVDAINAAAREAMSDICKRLSGIAGRGDAVLAVLATRGPAAAGPLAEGERRWRDVVAAAETLSAALLQFDGWAAGVIGPSNG